MITQKRVSEMLREATTFLVARGEPTKRSEVFEHLSRTLDFTPEERQPVQNGDEAWLDRFQWMSNGLDKAGWVEKDRGVWTHDRGGSRGVRAISRPDLVLEGD